MLNMNFLLKYQKIALLAVITCEICLFIIFYLSSRDGNLMNGIVSGGVLLFFSWILIPLMTYAWATSLYLLIKSHNKLVKLISFFLMITPSLVIFEYIRNFDSLFRFVKTFSEKTED